MMMQAVMAVLTVGFEKNAQEDSRAKTGRVSAMAARMIVRMVK